MAIHEAKHSLGTHFAKDNSGLVQSVNLCRYVGNSPVNYSDPTGLEEVELGGVARAQQRLDQAIRERREAEVELKQRQRAGEPWANVAAAQKEVNRLAAEMHDRWDELDAIQPQLRVFSIQIFNINGSGVSDEEIRCHVKRANAIWSHANIQIELVNITNLTKDESLPILGADARGPHWPNWNTSGEKWGSREPDELTAPERNLDLKSQPARNPKTVVQIYYVNRIFPVPGTRAAGLTYPGSCNTIVIAGAVANDTTLAHELGHSLTGSMEHADYTYEDYLMDGGIHDNTKLRPSDINDARNAPILRKPR
jgi:hypothetical protein